MPEDLPVRKCINVMVGITRSKVIFLMLLPIVPKEDQNPFSPRHLVEDTTVTVNVMVLDMPRKFV